MNRITLFSIVCLITLSTRTSAQDASVFPKGEVSATDNHTGTVWLSELNAADSILNLSLAQATFAPGAKLDWHFHPAGQYLLVTEGSGYYQERGKAIKLVRKGDVVRCLPGVEHWHGASPGSGFAYIGVTPTQRGKTGWLKRVTDEEYRQGNATPVNTVSAEQEIIALSKKKWGWMADRNADSLSKLFADKSMFVHMGGSWGKIQELATIKGGGIWYKKAEVHSVTVNLFGNTAVLLNDIDLEAVVGGNTVTNSFMVTEVYIKEAGEWKMGSLTFSHLARPVKMNSTK